MCAFGRLSFAARLQHQVLHFKSGLKTRKRLGHQPPVTALWHWLGAEQTGALEPLFDSA
jgi:hypothetical protein